MFHYVMEQRFKQLPYVFKNLNCIHKFCSLCTSYREVQIKLSSLFCTLCVDGVLEKYYSAHRNLHLGTLLIKLWHVVCKSCTSTRQGDYKEVYNLTGGHNQHTASANTVIHTETCSGAQIYAGHSWEFIPCTEFLTGVAVGTYRDIKLLLCMSGGKCFWQNLFHYNHLKIIL